MDFEKLQELRRALIAAGRSLVVGEGLHAVQPQMHFYVLAFNGGRGVPRLIRSGIFHEATVGVASLGGPRGRRGVALAMIRWDGEIELSRHPLEAVGLSHTSPQPMLLAVQSLEGIDPPPTDERPRKQREADPITPPE